MIKSPDRKKVLNNSIVVIAIIMVLFQLISARYMFMQPMRMVVVHGGFALIIIYLDSLKKSTSKRLPILQLLMLALSVISIGYVVWNYNDLIATKGLLSNTEIFIGVLIFIVFFEATRKSFGWTIPLFTLIFLVNVFIGHHFPQPFWHPKIPFDFTVASAGIGLTGGVFGKPLTVSANFVFLFILFGVLLRVTKADEFFMEVAKIPGKWLASGPALSAVISSALVGTVSGSGQANVAITGPFTIPLMKRAGYTPAQAGGIEAAASSGGSIMPPIMGIVAFVMAKYTATPYVKLIVMALIPALLYYLCIAIFVHLQACKLGIKHIKQEINIKKIIIGAPLFLVPIAVLLFLLIEGHSLRFTVFYMSLTLVVISLFRKESRGTLKGWIEGFTKGALLGSQIAVVLGLVGAMMAFMDLTGLMIKFPSIIIGLSGGNLYILLVLAAIITIILGCGLPPFASYLLVAMLIAPALIDSGLAKMQAHFFIYFYAVFALITPPIGLANMVAAPICGASYLQTSKEAVRAGIIAWILPILVVGAPAIIFMPQGDVFTWLPKIIACPFMVLLLQITLGGYYLKNTNLLDRVISALGTLSLLIYIAAGIIVLGYVGAILLIVLTGKQFTERKRFQSRIAKG